MTPVRARIQVREREGEELDSLPRTGSSEGHTVSPRVGAPRNGKAQFPWEHLN